MKNVNRKPYAILFDDPVIQRALSSVGVFANDYETGDSFRSILWEELDYSLDILDANRGWLEFIHPKDRVHVRAAMEAVFSGKSDAFCETYRLRRPDGKYTWIQSKGKTLHVAADGKPLLYIGADYDITELKETEKRLRRSHQRERRRREEMETIGQAAAIIGSSLDPQETINQVLEQVQRVIPYNQATVQILNGSQLEVVGGYGFAAIEPILKLRFPFPERGSLSTRAIQEKIPILSNDVTNDFPAFIQPEQESAIHSWMGIPLIRRGDVIGLVAIDSFERDHFTGRQLELAAIIGDHVAVALENARLHEQTYQMAMQDALTGIGSRHRFQIEGRLLYENSKRAQRPISAAMVDVDHFKQFNDTCGHDVGDLVLRKIAESCGQDLRATDLLARFGGEEFVILLPETGEDAAEAAMERIRERVSTLELPETDLNLTVSIGLVSEIPPKNQPFDNIISKADVALYYSKQNGRNRTSRWTERM